MFIKFLYIAALLTTSVITFSQPVSEKWLTDYEKSGYKKTPRYKETMEYCRRLEKASPWIRVTSFGKSAEGRDLPLVIVSKDKTFDPAIASKSGNAILLIQNGIHAGEIDGKDACLMLLRDIVITKTKASLLDHVILLIIPMYNVDGHERFGHFNRINQQGPEEMGWRVTAQNFNLNRDYTKADAPETQAWLKLFNAWLPDFFVDCHVTDGADFQYPVTYAIENDLNVALPVLSWIREKYFPALSKVAFGGIPLAEYIFLKDALDPLKGLDGGGVAPPRFSTSYVPIQNRPGLLIETHMLKEYRIRVEGTYTLLEATIRRMNEEYVSLRKAVRLADEQTAHALPSSYAIGFDQVNFPNKTVEFLGVKQKNEPSEISGGTWITYTNEPMTLNIPRYDSVVISKTIQPPVAYVIPQQWSEVIRRLKMHGLRLERLTSPATLEVDMYRFSNASWARTPFEGRHLATFSVTGSKRKEQFPTGTYICRLNQRAAKVAMQILEPEAPDSYAAWGFFDAVFEQKEYAEDYVMERMAREMIEDNSTLKDDFDAKLKADTAFARDPFARLNFFYMHSPFWDDRVNLYPVARLMSEQPLRTESVQ